MGKRLLFIVMYIPFTIFIIGCMVSSLVSWIVRGKDVMHWLDWGTEQMNKLLR